MFRRQESLVQTSTTQTGIAKYPPTYGWLPRYQNGWMRVDLLAGLPQAMACARVTWMPV